MRRRRIATSLVHKHVTLVSGQVPNFSPSSPKVRTAPGDCSATSRQYSIVSAAGRNGNGVPQPLRARENSQHTTVIFGQEVAGAVVRHEVQQHESESRPARCSGFPRPPRRWSTKIPRRVLGSTSPWVPPPDFRCSHAAYAWICPIRSRRGNIVRIGSYCGPPTISMRPTSTSIRSRSMYSG